MPNTTHEIAAKIICDSIGQHSIRLTTIQIHIPKFLLAELNKHRVFSGSANSSRAIPCVTIRRQVLSSPFTPIYWGENQSGMEAQDELTGWRLALAKAIYKSASINAVAHHWLLDKIGLHKQHNNRIIEPYMWADGVITSCEWQNFLNLRLHYSAQPEMRALAYAIGTALHQSKPDELEPGDWHLPYISPEDVELFTVDECCNLAAARCARVSYGLTTEWNSIRDFARAKLLRQSNPPHSVPFEHAAMCLENNESSGNFIGWKQYRKILETANKK